MFNKISSMYYKQVGLKVKKYDFSAIFQQKWSILGDIECSEKKNILSNFIVQ